MRVVVLIWFMIVLIATIAIPQTQDRHGLEERRKRLMKEINNTTIILKQIDRNKKATLAKYKALQEQIEKRKELIDILEKEVTHLTGSIERTSDAVNSLSDDIYRLKDEYAGMLRNAFRQKITKSRPLFVLSASSFNGAFQRWQYLRQYDRYRQKQARLINETQKVLKGKIYILEQRKSDKQMLLESAQRQSELLSLELVVKDRLLEELRDDEGRMQRQLQQKQAEAQKLQKSIAAIIKAEMEKVSSNDKPDKPLTSGSPAGNTDLSNDFQNNKGKLAWPVHKGYVSSKFGSQPHPSLKSVMITNNGIDIQTEAGASVHAVFKGEVVGVQYIPGFQYTIILRHGKYYTVYSKLQEVNVSKGEAVNSRQNIGKVHTDIPTNLSELHFEIWQEKTIQNPQLWINGTF